jgi:hypothetical protein
VLIGGSCLRWVIRGLAPCANLSPPIWPIEKTAWANLSLPLDFEFFYYLCLRTTLTHIKPSKYLSSLSVWPSATFSASGWHFDLNGKARMAKSSDSSAVITPS